MSVCSAEGVPRGLMDTARAAIVVIEAKDSLKVTLD